MAHVELEVCEGGAGFQGVGGEGVAEDICLQSRSGEVGGGFDFAEVTAGDGGLAGEVWVSQAASTGRMVMWRAPPVLADLERTEMIRHHYSFC